MNRDYPRILVDAADLQSLPSASVDSKPHASNQVTEVAEFIFEHGQFKPSNQASTDDSRAVALAKRGLKVSFASIADPDIRHLDISLPSHQRLLDKSFSSAFENARIAIALWGASASLAVVSALWVYAAYTDQQRYLQPGLAAAYRLFVTLAMVGDLCIGRRGLPAFAMHLSGLVTAMIAASSDDYLTSLEIAVSSDSQKYVASRACFAFAGGLLSLWGVVGSLIPN